MARLLAGAQFRARACVCISPESPKLETTRSLHAGNSTAINVMPEGGGGGGGTTGWGGDFDKKLKF